MAGRTVAVIPARYASTRFPGKPLAELDGTPMIVRVARQASRAALIHHVCVATDDTRIRTVVEAAGFEVVMTPSTCASGTDRVAAAVGGAEDVALVVNVQGDEPLVDPRDLDALVSAMSTSDAELGTLARPIDVDEAFVSPHTVKVAVRADGRAMYFSRAPIPHGGRALALQHVGIYAYRPAALRALAALPRSPLEIAESLEQLRALEHGFSIQVARCVSARASIAVDVPEDAARVVEILRSERSTGHG